MVTEIAQFLFTLLQAMEDNTKNILDLIKCGDENTLQNIYVENREAFIKFSKKYNVERYDAVDIYQDAIIILRENVIAGKIVELKSSVSTYLFAIGKYKIFQSHRGNSKIELNNNFYTEKEYLNLDVDFSEEKPTNHQKLLNKNLQCLGERCKEILTLFYYEGYSLDEITQILNYSDKNVLKSQKSRCLKQLKSMINKK